MLLDLRVHRPRVEGVKLEACTSKHLATYGWVLVPHLLLHHVLLHLDLGPAVHTLELLLVQKLGWINTWIESWLTNLDSWLVLDCKELVLRIFGMKKYFVVAVALCWI